jgi:hypothetical protein
VANSDISRPSALARSDLWVGAALFVIGLYACWEASGFDDDSRSYPMILGGLLAAAGLAVALTGLLKADKALCLAGPLRVALPAAVVVALWATALGAGGGFVLPTLLMQIALLWLGGVRGPLRIAVYSALITAAAYTLFALVLDVRLPAPAVSWLV